jgi:hypothetical protein
MGDEIGTTPAGATVTQVAQASTEIEPFDDGGFKSRKWMTGIGLALVLFGIGIAGRLVMGQYGADGIWQARIGESALMQICDLACIVGLGTGGLSMIEKVMGLFAQRGQRP